MHAQLANECNKLEMALTLAGILEMSVTLVGVLIMVCCCHCC